MYFLPFVLLSSTVRSDFMFTSGCFIAVIKDASVEKHYQLGRPISGGKKKACIGLQYKRFYCQLKMKHEFLTSSYFLTIVNKV